MEITGKYNKAVIFTENIDSEALSQIYNRLNIPAFDNTQIRIMPDVHFGNGSVVGFTMKMNQFIVPKVIGVDIGCGMTAYKIGKNSIDLPEFDCYLRQHIPSGRETNEDRSEYIEPTEQLLQLIEKVGLKDYQRIIKSVGTLGGGNHFIEMAKDENDELWLIIHSGSRYLGVLVCEYHIQKAKKYLREKYKGAGAFFGLEYIAIEEGGDEYIDDIKITQQYASTNRKVMAQQLIEGYFGKKLKDCQLIETVHNYINFKDNIIRKGAISAAKNELVVIPMNMRDGSILARGKGNAEWNFSAPHGAGRLFSRAEAKEIISLTEFEKEMKNVYSSSINSSTIDESPMVYKPMAEILEKIEDTVEIISFLKPVYNFKAGV